MRLWWEGVARAGGERWGTAQLLFRMGPAPSPPRQGLAPLQRLHCQPNPILCVCSGIRKCCKSPAREELEPLLKVGLGKLPAWGVGNGVQGFDFVPCRRFGEVTGLGKEDGALQARPAPWGSGGSAEQARGAGGLEGRAACRVCAGSVLPTLLLRS